MELTLSARHDIVRNAFARELHAKVKHTIYEALAAMTPAAEPPHKAWVEARRLGIDCPEPRPQFERWRPAPADQVRHAPADPHAVTPNPDTDVLMSQVWETSFTGLVARADEARRGRIAAAAKRERLPRTRPVRPAVRGYGRMRGGHRGRQDLRLERRAGDSTRDRRGTDGHRDRADARSRP